jgi:fucokinase
MSEYWRHKKIMAGEGSGAEPDFVKVVLEHLTSKGDIVGGTLCGAGGGGFLAMLAAEGKTAVDIKASIETTAIDEVNLFSWHSCTVDNNGLIVNVINSE